MIPPKPSVTTLLFVLLLVTGPVRAADATRDWLQRAIAEAATIPDGADKLDTLVSCASTARELGSRDACISAIQLLERTIPALEAGEQGRDKRQPRWNLYISMAGTQVWLGQFGGADKTLEALDRSMCESLITLSLTTAYLERGDVVSANKVAAQAKNQEDRQEYLNWVEERQVAILVKRNKLSEAKLAVSLLSDPTLKAEGLLIIGKSHAKHGDMEAARTLLNEASPLIERSSDKKQFELYTDAAHVAAMLRDERQMRVMLARARGKENRVEEGVRQYTVPALAQALVYAGHLPEAEDALAKSPPSGFNTMVYLELATAWHRAGHREKYQLIIEQLRRLDSIRGNTDGLRGLDVVETQVQCDDIRGAQATLELILDGRYRARAAAVVFSKSTASVDQQEIDRWIGGLPSPMERANACIQLARDSVH